MTRTARQLPSSTAARCSVRQPDLRRAHWSPRWMTPVTSRMLVISLGNGERVRPLEAPLQGMRAAVTGAVDFTGCTADPHACLGEPGDYLREPDFSAGAWRGSAVAAGGLRSLIEHGNRPVANSRPAGQSASSAAPGQRHDRLGDQPSLGSSDGTDRGRSKRRCRRAQWPMPGSHASRSRRRASMRCDLCSAHWACRRSGAAIRSSGFAAISARIFGNPHRTMC